MNLNLTAILAAVTDEIYRATEKFPTWPDDPLHALGIVGEEFGELTKEVMQLTYDPPAVAFPRSTKAHVRAEAIQLAAMALRFAASLDAYIYQPSADHKQAETPVVGQVIPPKPSLLQLEAGKYYLRRDGVVMGPLRANDSALYPFCCVSPVTENFLSWTSRGHGMADRREMPTDLIAEVGAAEVTG